MQFIKELPPLNKPLLNDIFKIVQSDNQPFEPSLLYEVATKQKILDTNERISEFKLIRTPELFSLIDSYVQELNQLDDDNNLGNETGYGHIDSIIWIYANV